MLRSSLVATVICSAVTLGMLAVSPANANLTIGGANARSVAMGGAGLAVRNNADEIPVNVALLAESSGRISLETPTFDMRMDGAKQTDAQGLLGQYILDPSKAFSLALDLGKQDTFITTSVTTGIKLPFSNVSAWASMDTKIVPNEAYQTWANSGGLLLPFLPDAAADVYSIGVISIPVSIGIRLPANGGDLDFGVRIKPTRAYYSHFIVNKDAVENNEPVLAPEMGGEKFLSQESLAADIGLLYSPPGMRSLRLAAVVNNIVQPKPIDFNSPSVTGMLKQDVSATTINVGAAVENRDVTLAADLLDVTEQYGSSQLRLGAELRPMHSIAIRAGYTEDGVSYGLGLGGFNIAVTGSDTLAFGQTVKF